MPELMMFSIYQIIHPKRLSRPFYFYLSSFFLPLQVSVSLFQDEFHLFSSSVSSFFTKILSFFPFRSSLNSFQNILFFCLLFIFFFYFPFFSFLFSSSSSQFLFFSFSLYFVLLFLFFYSVFFSIFLLDFFSFTRKRIG